MCMRTQRRRVPNYPYQFDKDIADYIEEAWHGGEGLQHCRDLKCGWELAFPHLKHQLRIAAQLVRAWSMKELPDRAPLVGDKPTLDCDSAAWGLAAALG